VSVSAVLRYDLYWMAFILVSGRPGCRPIELARIIAQKLAWDLVTEASVAASITQEFGDSASIPPKAWPPLATSILARQAVERPWVGCFIGAELLFPNLAGALRVQSLAPLSRRISDVMADFQLDRPAARETLRKLDAEAAETRRARFGRSSARAQDFDLLLNAASFDAESLAALVEAAARSRGLLDQGSLAPALEAQIQFQVRLQLAKFGLVPPDRARPARKTFGHPSEQIFANLLDFYRIPWEHEPRSFPLQWDKDGKVLEAFTPDFYLPEFDLYVELTTMKQALVTRKNRKIRLLRSIYPHVHIQIFYQKDFEDLIAKYGLAERALS
jgi:hypothetical protein